MNIHFNKVKTGEVLYRICPLLWVVVIGIVTGSLFLTPVSAFATTIVAPTVVSQSASDVATTTATLNGNIIDTGGADATDRGFAWGTTATLSGDDTATTTESGSFSAGAFTGSLDSLSPGTTYYSRAFAINSVGISFGSISASFTMATTGPQTPLSVTGLPTDATYADAGISAGTSGGSGTGAITFSVGTSTACSVDASFGDVTITSGTGSCSVVATKADDSNYTEVVSAPVFITIHKATPTLSVSNTPVVFSGSPRSALVEGSVPGTVSNIKYNTSATAPTAVGTYAVTADFTPDDTENYNTLTDASAGNFVINVGISQDTLTVTGLPTDATYADAGISAGTSGGSGAGAITFSVGTSTACSVDASSGSVSITSGTGDCSITVTKEADSVYSVATSAPVFITTHKKNITVTADAQSKIAGAADPSLTYSSSDASSSFTGALIRTIGETVGTYSIEQGTLVVAGNKYAMTFVPASFVIAAASSGGGGGGGPVVGLLGSAIGAACPYSLGTPQQPDINGDGVVNVLDFNQLMVNWGETGQQAADINRDCIIDVLDFNRLMISWSV